MDGFRLRYLARDSHVGARLWSRACIPLSVMKVHSFVRIDHELVPTEIEVTLVQGLPQFVFIGLPDASLRESGARIRAALKKQDFELPHSQQILVHIKPTYAKKTSRGLDLPIACALLWEMNQLLRPTSPQTLYGELTLEGEVIQPDDVLELPSVAGDVITGTGEDVLPFNTIQITSLRDMLKGGASIASSEADDFQRPRCSVKFLDAQAAVLARVVAAGEHSLLLAGPAGSGKSTLASVLPSLVEAPTQDQIREVRHFWNARNERLTWRPVLKPHHSITPLAMIGGGSSLWPGEITRAHNGILIMDELLEFHPEIQESLREPVENGSLSIVRGGRSRTFPARVLLLATTNLCKCGKFVPRKVYSCRCASAVRRRILTRLTGPFVDRFAVVALTDQWDDKGDVSLEQIASDVAGAIEFRKVARPTRT